MPYTLEEIMTEEELKKFYIQRREIKEVYSQILEKYGIEEDFEWLYSEGELGDIMTPCGEWDAPGAIITESGKVFHYLFWYDEENKVYSLGKETLDENKLPCFREFTPEEYKELESDRDYIRLKKEFCSSGRTP